MANNIPSGSFITPARLSNGWVGETSPTAATTSTGTETMHASITATLATGRRYRVSYRGQIQSSIAGDRVGMRYRIAAGATVTTTGTSLRAMGQDIDVATRNNGVAFDHILTVATAGQWTVGISITRVSGTGTVKIDYLAGVIEPLMWLEDIGGV